MKDLKKYKAIILDVDGTLYFQKPLRINMLLELLKYYVIHPIKIKELLILKDYRKNRENIENSFDKNFIEHQYSIVGKKFNLKDENVKKIVSYWIHTKPLKYVAKYKDSYLIKKINLLHNKGISVFIYSDYPAEEKIKVLDLTCDKIFSGDDKEISCLKPNTKGLEYILENTGIKKEEVIFIGDRYEKDGICAKQFGIDYIILSSKKKKRYKQIGDL